MGVIEVLVDVSMAKRGVTRCTTTAILPNLELATVHGARCTNLVKEEEEKIKVLYKKIVHRAPLAKYLFSNLTKKNSRQVPLSFPL